MVISLPKGLKIRYLFIKNNIMNNTLKNNILIDNTKQIVNYNQLEEKNINDVLYRIYDNNICVFFDIIQKNINNMKHLSNYNQLREKFIDDIFAKIRKDLEYTNINHVTFSDTRDFPLVRNSTRILPDCVTEIHIYDYTLPIVIDGISIFHNNIEKIVFTTMGQGQEVDYYNIDFNRSFYNPLVVNGIRGLPPKVKSVSFDDFFNQPLIYTYKGKTIKALPDSITELSFGTNFNQSLYNALPPKLNVIKFKYCFKGSINNYNRIHSINKQYDTTIYQILKNINFVYIVHVFEYPKSSTFDTHDELINVNDLKGYN